jgi:hypothetical protein
MCRVMMFSIIIGKKVPSPKNKKLKEKTPSLYINYHNLSGDEIYVTVSFFLFQRFPCIGR